MAGGQGRFRGYLLLLIIKSFSLISIYALYGLLQERIMKGQYFNTATTKLETFASAPLLVLCNRLVSLTTGLLLAQLLPLGINLPPLPQSTTDADQPQNRASAVSGLINRIRPGSPFLHYALVAGLNNAATLSQYCSLSYLSFTTSTLGKSTKMIPVLIIDHLWYGKKYKQRQWIGALLVTFGVWGYLVSLLYENSSGQHKITNMTTTKWYGVIFLLAYLFFDGRTSTLQEKLFGDANKLVEGDESGSLMGITSGIIDQMIWVNFFSSLIALSLLALYPYSQTTSSLDLAVNSPELQFHILLLSLTASLGVLLLFHVIAVYGALVASMSMTIRQFVSILTNAAAFGNVAQVPMLGWAGIGVMVAGIWIKMDWRYDGQTVQVTSMDSNEKVVLEKKGSRWLTSLKQYAIPVGVCPIGLVLMSRIIEMI